MRPATPLSVPLLVAVLAAVLAAFTAPAVAATGGGSAWTADVRATSIRADSTGWSTDPVAVRAARVAGLHGTVASPRVPAGLTPAVEQSRAWPVGDVTRAFGASRDAVHGATPASQAESVTASGAAAWQAAGWTGAGVRVAVVDAGFGGLAAAERAGDLPASQVVYPKGQDHCAHDAAQDHGTAVAEIVHQTAPGATIYLYCVDDAAGVTRSENQLQAAHVRVVNTSLAFVGDGRGDGTGPAGSVELAVRKARRAGILWVSAAGNSAQDHWSGRLADRNHDGLADLAGARTGKEYDEVFVDGGGSADLTLTWNQWPRSSAKVGLLAVEVARCRNAGCTRVTAVHRPEPVRVVHRAKRSPSLQIPVVNTFRYPAEWQLVVQVGKGFPKVRYDLTYLGDVTTSYLASRSAAYARRAASGSIAEPASSPYALAVGALDVDPTANYGAGACESDTSDSAYPLEAFSSRGPTIDGRVKPDLAGYDGVSSPVYGEHGFCGTSAATPGVAGDAALVAQAFPSYSAAALEAFLVRRANNGAPYARPTDGQGSGRVTLGPPPAHPTG